MTALLADDVVWGWPTPEDEAWARKLSGGDGVPPMPPAALQERFVGSSGEIAFGEPAIFWRRVCKTIERDGRPAHARSRILDVGVGWGRIYRWLMRDVSPARMIGVDIDPACIDLCRRAMPQGRFELVGSRPPRRDMDVALAYSVFSHLSESVARSTLAYIRQALKPGGHVALTTLAIGHLRVWQGYMATESHGRATLLASQGFNSAKWLERAAAGEALYLPTGGGSDLLSPELYGETILPRSWFATVDGFRLVDFSDRPDLPQATAVLRKL